MAVETINRIHAACVYNGVTETLIGSVGVVEVTRTGEGEYVIELESGLEAGRGLPQCWAEDGGVNTVKAGAQQVAERFWAVSTTQAGGFDVDVPRLTFRLAALPVGS